MKLPTSRTIIPLLTVAVLSGAAWPMDNTLPPEAVTVPSANTAADPAPQTTPATEGTFFAPESSVPAAGELTVRGGTPKQRSAALEAAGLFETAGLDLPGVLIEIHPTSQGCDGYDGAFRTAAWRLDVCNGHRLIVLHELAHAWEHARLTDEIRDEFMELRGLTSWNDGSTPWKDRGIEDLAEIVVWGLRELAADRPVTPDAERQEAFRLLTGLDLSVLRATEASVANSATQRDDPVEADPDFDSWR